MATDISLHTFDAVLPHGITLACRINAPVDAMGRLPDAAAELPRVALRFPLDPPAVLSAVLGVVYRTISGHLLGEARLTRRDGHTGAITLIQRFGSAPRP